MKKCPMVTVTLVMILGVASQAFSADNSESTKRSTPATSSNRARKVVATGTIQPAKVVDVSSQLPGRIVSFGPDPHAEGKTIDYGSVVEAGTILAQLDSSLYEIRVEQEQAGCKVAEAELAKQQAELELAEALSKNADRTDLKLKYKIAKASVAAAEAALAKKKADLKEAQLKLSYTAIKSPIKGVVLARRANIGQIANPEQNVPSLFLIVDSKKLTIWASVNEADISRIRQQQPVRFTVDAFPGKVFEGKVTQIRQNATMVQNMVLYTVVIEISSPTDKLLPYLTANVEFAD